MKSVLTQLLNLWLKVIATAAIGSPFRSSYLLTLFIFPQMLTADIRFSALDMSNAVDESDVFCYIEFAYQRNVPMTVIGAIGQQKN